MLEPNIACKNDEFANIAQRGIDFSDRTLVTPKPQNDVKKALPITDGNTYKREYPKKMDSEAELSAELERQRKIYEPFMRNLAPGHKDYRTKQYLREFDYRLQTEEDIKDFYTVLSGRGEWEKVKIPHYGGPVGKVTAYYRTSFNLCEDDFENKNVFACFKAVDYKAHVFVNNSFVGSHEGFFAPFEFDITQYARLGENIIVVICENDFVHVLNGDKIYAATGLGWDDPNDGWHHCPPGMGICQDCYIEARPKVHMRDIFVRPVLEEDKAICRFETYSCYDEDKKISFKISVYGQNFEETVFCDREFIPTSVYECGVGDTPTQAEMIRTGNYNSGFELLTKKRINTFEYEFSIPNVRVWDTATPYLYRIIIKVIDENGTEIDAMSRHFGMRSFTQDVECEGKKGAFYLNGKFIKLRGANTMGHEQQCVFKKDFDQLRDDILLAKICNINFWRITQRPVEEEVYDYMDMLGLMAQTDLPLFGRVRRNQFVECVRQAGEMERLVRSHPCCIIDSYINEPFPNADNKPNACLTREEMNAMFEACDIVVHQQNPDRVIKAIDGDYDPPSKYLPDNHCYPGWYNGHGIDMGKLYKGYWMPVKDGWYYGCGEFGSEGLDPICVMKNYYPKEWLPQNEEEEKNWTPNSIVRAQAGSFYYFFYEKPKTMVDWVNDSQEHQAWATKIMTESFRRNNGVVTFAIHLLIDAFPSGWMKAIMDFERRPKLAFFAYRDALAPIMVSLRSDRHTVFSGEEISWEAWVSNDGEGFEGAKLYYHIEREDGSVLYSGREEINCGEWTSECFGKIKFEAPSVLGRETFKITLGLFDKNDNLIDYNTETITVFGKNDSLSGKAYIIGDVDGKAKTLAEDVGLETDFSDLFDGNSLILIDDYEKYSEVSDKVKKAVVDGAKAIFIELPVGEYDIFGCKVVSKACAMQPVSFVARDTDHKYVEGFENKDFRNWYDKACDYITPLLENTLHTDEFTPILTSGNNGCGWKMANAACDKVCGKGSIVLSNVKLSGRTKENPVADLFAKKILK